MCDYLIVGVNSDDLVREYKHKTPAVSETQRAEIVSSLNAVNQCAVVTTLDKKEAFSKFHFDIIFIGDDWRGNSRWEQTKIEMDKLGGELAYLPHTKGVSTTELTKFITNE